jgi:hypothetical protein
LAVAFLFGYGGRILTQWKSALLAMAPSFAIGGLLAAPVLLGQLEFFLLGARSVSHTFNPLGYGGFIASLSALFPWGLGTFRTIDASKLADQSLHYGFALFVGSAVVCLSVLGFCRSLDENPRREPLRRTSLWIILFYLLLISTPLVNVVYLRCSGLPALALVILAALGLDRARSYPLRYQSAVRWIGAAAITITLSIHLVAWVVYPRLAHHFSDVARGYRIDRLGNAEALREFQLANFSAETTFRNPETLLAVLGLVVLAGLLASRKQRPAFWQTLLVLNLLPVLLFAHRFVPAQPLECWHRLLHGGNAQELIASRLSGSSLRLNETASRFADRVFPNAMSHLYRVRTVHGYSALQPRGLALLASTDLAKIQDRVADVEFCSTNSLGRLACVTAHTNRLARFQWLDHSTREFRVEEETLNTIKIRFASGGAQRFLWTDTFYPGWTARLNGHVTHLSKEAPCFSALEIPSAETKLELHYRPTYLKAGLGLAFFGLLGLIATLARPRRPEIPRMLSKVPDDLVQHFDPVPQ